MNNESCCHVDLDVSCRVVSCFARMLFLLSSATSMLRHHTQLGDWSHRDEGRQVLELFFLRFRVVQGRRNEVCGSKTWP